MAARGGSTQPWRAATAHGHGQQPRRTAMASSGGGPCVAMEAAAHDHCERRRSERDCRRRSGRNYGGGHSGTEQLRWPAARQHHGGSPNDNAKYACVELSSGGDSSGSDDEMAVPEDFDEKMTIPAVENESQNEDVKPADSYRSTRSPKGSPATKAPAAKKPRASPKEKQPAVKKKADAVLAWSIAHDAQNKAKMDDQRKQSVYCTYTEVPRCYMDE
ncbi:hypothetical protein ACP70R_028407 [Stipagrostis hirtigluma subsp. patula]